MVVFPGAVVRGRYKPIVVTVIIVINMFMYLHTSLSSDNPLLASSTRSFYEYGFIPYYLLTDPLEGLSRAFTSMFVHADIIHIFFNMYFLWLFGSRLEGFIGHGKTLLLYLLSGLSAVLFHVAFTTIGGYDALAIPAVGASGAISGILGAYLLTLPRTKLVMCWFLLLVPFCFSLSAEAFMIIWFIQQVLYGYMRLGGVAYFAHIGGFVMGLLLAPLLTRRVARPGLTPEILRYVERVLGIIIPRPRGVSPATKAILSLLFLVIAGSFVYASLTTSTVQLYVSNVEVLCVEGCREAGRESDQVIFALTPRGLMGSTSVQENVRILINRLIGTPYIYNAELASKEEYVEWSGPVSVLGVSVPVNISMTAKYDELGVVVESRGVMRTRSVVIRESRIFEGEFMTLNFTMTSSRVHRAGYALSGLCLLSAGISILAIGSIIASRGVLLPAREEIFTPYL